MKIYCYISEKLLTPLTNNIDLDFGSKNSDILYLIIRNELEQPVNITDDEIYIVVKDTTSQTDADAKINKKITSFTFPTSGETEIEFTNTDTANLVSNYLYQIKIKHSSKWYTLAEGTILFSRSIISRES